MKNYLRYCLVIILAVISVHSSAQINTGYLFGVNLTTMSVKVNGISYPAERPFAIHFGQYFEIPFNDNFAFEPALKFSAKGADYVIDSTDFSISPIYFEVPLNVKLRFGSRSVKVSLYGGPYFACGIGGYKIVSGGELKDIRYGKNDYNDLRRFDIGYNLGAGISIKGFSVSVQYGVGLSDISPITALETEMKNQVIGITFRSAGGGSR
ncbi:MAG: PorT family protein [Bacteroidales bacterium]|nr:PorT family protein [Bacteroidales bacterium]